MTRVYNFSAGPACLPEWVLKKAASEMLDAHNSGMVLWRCPTVPVNSRIL